MGSIINGCSKEDNLQPQPQPQEEDNIVKQSITVGFNETKRTKALAVDLVNQTGIKTFAVNDQIAVIYENTNDKTVKVVSEKLTAGNITNEGKTATFTLTLTNPKSGGNVRYIYPAAMAKTTISDTDPIDNEHTINYNALETQQNGDLTTLGSNFDLAIWDDHLTSGEHPELPVSVGLDNPLAICVFTLKENKGTELDPDYEEITNTITGMTIFDGTYTYTVNREAAEGPIYVAIRPTAVSLSITATDGSNHYYKSLSSREYKKNNGYSLSLRMQPLSGNVVMGNMIVFDLEQSDFPGLTSLTDITTAIIYQSTSDDTTKHTITIPANMKLILDGVNILAGDANAISCSGNDTIVVSGTNIVKNASVGTYGRAIIKAGPSGTELRFIGGGKLTASSNYSSSSTEGAIIGSDKNDVCGNIVIEGCEIEAKKYSGLDLQGAAIGAGKAQSGNSECGDISIIGAKVTVETTVGAGIGSGECYTNGNHSYCGNIVIRDSKVTATASAGAAIGSGYVMNGTTQCGNIHILGSSSIINATTTDNGAAIGSGSKSQAGTGIITIEGGSVTARNTRSGTNNGGAGIGCGYYAKCGNILISGGIVTAQGGPQAAGIGSAKGSSSKPSECGTIEITSAISEVTATRGSGSNTVNCIGKGYKDYSTCVTVTIDGTTSWTAGTDTAHLKFSVSNEGKTWTLTPKSE